MIYVRKAVKTVSRCLWPKCLQCVLRCGAKVARLVKVVKVVKVVKMVKMVGKRCLISQQFV